MKAAQKVGCDEKRLSALVRMKNLSLFFQSSVLSEGLGCRQQQPLEVLSGKKLVCQEM